MIIGQMARGDGSSIRLRCPEASHGPDADIAPALEVRGPLPGPHHIPLGPDSEYWVDGLPHWVAECPGCGWTAWANWPALLAEFVDDRRGGTAEGP